MNVKRDPRGEDRAPVRRPSGPRSPEATAPAPGRRRRAFVDPELGRRWRAAVAETDQLRTQARLAVRAPAAASGQAVKDVKDTNFIFTWFILHNLPPVVLGLVIAAIFAAALSSSDSVLNSLAAAAVVDFYKRWLRPDATEAQAVRASEAYARLAPAVPAEPVETRGAVT